MGRETERHRQLARQDRVLAFLLQRGPIGATNSEVCAVDVGGLGGVRRVWELGRQGYQVRKAHEGAGRWRYWIDGFTAAGQSGRLF